MYIAMGLCQGPSFSSSVSCSRSCSYCYCSSSWQAIKVRVYFALPLYNVIRMRTYALIAHARGILATTLISTVGSVAAASTSFALLNLLLGTEE